MNAKTVKGWTPLHNADNKEIAAGTVVNAKHGRGYTPLHRQAVNGHKEIVELLNRQRY